MRSKGQIHPHDLEKTLNQFSIGEKELESLYERRYWVGDLNEIVPLAKKATSMT